VLNIWETTCSKGINQHQHNLFIFHLSHDIQQISGPGWYESFFKDLIPRPGWYESFKKDRIKLSVKSGD
jgi:hypothetical protein